MVYENYVNLTISQVIEGSQPFSPSLLVTLIISCFGIAFGAQWGFNKIYNLDKVEKFKGYRNELISNLKFKLKVLALKKHKNDEEFNKEINDFVEGWQNFQENIKDYYDGLLWWRKEILYVFSLAGISYFFRLIRPDLILLYEYKIAFISNLLLFFGLISIFIFVYKIIKLDDQITKYTIEKSSSKKIINKITKRVFNSKT